MKIRRWDELISWNSGHSTVASVLLAAFTTGMVRRRRYA